MDDPHGNGHKDHPEVLENENPAFLSSGFSLVTDFLQTYGWCLVLLAIVYLYFRDRINQQFASAQRRVETIRDNANYDPQTAHRRQIAMDEARRRLQEKYDQDTARHAEKMKQKEEEKRQEKIEDWDRHLEGKGYRSKLKPDEATSSSGSAAQRPAAKKNTLRSSDYNPLMGGPSAGFRPARRGGGGARGG